MTANDMIPYEFTHPGDIVKEELEYRGISQKQFVEIIGVSYTMLNDICKWQTSSKYRFCFNFGSSY